MIFPILAVLLVVCNTCDADLTCDKWASTASLMTGNGRLQTCVSNATNVCTRLDCQGSFTERFTHLIEVDYCYGIKLNSCLDPLSMDFYLNLPSHDSSYQFRISHDQVIYLQDLNLPFLKMMSMRPLLDFEFERDEVKDSVLISITFKLRTNVGQLYLDDYEKKIFEEEEVPIQHCDGPLTVDKTKKPSKDFMHSFACHPQKYPTMKPKTLVPATHVSPSETLNKTCDFNHVCSQGETCKLTSGTEGICACEPDYYYSEELKKCVGQGSVGIECEFDGQCGVYEKCRSESTTSKLLKCRCEKSFSWDEERRLCVMNSRNEPFPSHGSVTPKQSEDHTESGESTLSPKEPPVIDKTVSASTSNTKYIVIAASAVGAAVVVAVTVAVILLCRRRRRNQFVTGGSLYDSHDSPMLGDTDDDVDLVM